MERNEIQTPKWSQKSTGADAPEHTLIMMGKTRYAILCPLGLVVLHLLPLAYMVKDNLC